MRRELLARPAPGGTPLADKANDTDAFRAETAERGTFANVPPRRADAWPRHALRRTPGQLPCRTQARRRPRLDQCVICPPPMQSTPLSPRQPAAPATPIDLQELRDNLFRPVPLLRHRAIVRTLRSLPHAGPLSRGQAKAVVTNLIVRRGAFFRSGLRLPAEAWRPALWGTPVPSGARADPRRKAASARIGLRRGDLAMIEAPSFTRRPDT